MHKTPKLRFNKFTEFWKFTNLEDAYIKGRIGWKNLTRDEYTKEGPYFISGKDINDGKIMWDTCEHITIERYEESPEIKLQNNDIILTQRGTLGNSAFIENLTKKATINANMILLRANKEIYPLYLYYIIKSDYFKKFIHKITSVGCISSLFQKDLKKFEFPYPSYEEQKEISYFLSEIDIKIDLMEQKNKKIKYDVKNYLLSNLFVENKEEDILSWDEKDLDNISSISTGNCDLKDNIEDGKYPFFVRSEKVERIDSYAYDGEAILIPGDGRVGEIFHYINGKFNYHQRVYKISDFKDVIGKYVYYYLQQYFLRHVHKYSVKATVDSLRLPIIKEMKIRYPSIKKQEKIVNILSCVDKKIELSNKQISLMKNYKKGLLQKMFI